MITLDCDEVADGLWVGTYPQTPEDVMRMKEMGITAVLSLQDAEDEATLGFRWDLFERFYAANGITAVRMPVKDFSPAALKERLPACVAEVHRLASAGCRLYLHCTAGLNRSPSVAIAYLVQHGGLSAEDAERQVRERRTCYPYAEVLASLR